MIKIKKLWLSLGLLVSVANISALVVTEDLPEVTRNIAALEDRVCKKIQEVVLLGEFGVEHQDMFKRMSLTLAEQLERLASLIKLQVKLLDEAEERL